MSDQWEYRVEVVPKKMDMNSVNFSKHVEEVANNCGKEGWELVKVSSGTLPLEEVILTFKRIKDNELNG